MRLILHGLPQGNSPFLSFFPLDLQGQSGYEILLIGQNINKLLPFPPQSWVLFEILPPQARRLLKWYVYVCIFPPMADPAYSQESGVQGLLLGIGLS